ncbi:MAG: hypothetical protein JW741_16425 [Sedimentisphaerales bacterium]|nr:hypothetical protein [Sedimentisphaerales bacterium]
MCIGWAERAPILRDERQLVSAVPARVRNVRPETAREHPFVDWIVSKSCTLAVLGYRLLGLGQVGPAQDDSLVAH